MGKHKRGARGSTEDTGNQQTPKRANMATAEEDVNTEEDEEEEETVIEPSLIEIREILVDIQITVSNILRENVKMANEIAELKNAVKQQQAETTALKVSLDKIKKQQDKTEAALYEAKAKINEQDDEIYELYDLQDKMEQYSRKNNLEIHGIPEAAYETTEEVVLKLAEALNVSITPNDIEISHKLRRKGVAKSLIVKFQSHKAKSKLYRERTKLKNISVSDLFPNLSASTLVQAERIFINENLTSYRRKIMSKANGMRRDGNLCSTWSMDGKIYIKTSPEGRPVRINDLEDLDTL